VSLEVLDSSSSLNHIGVKLRRIVDGPERNLVDWFLANEQISIPRGCKAIVFREPFLESGFPDLVIVIWTPSVSQSWSESRTKLRKSDFRVLHHLVRTGPATIEQLKYVFTERIEPALKRLEEAATIRSTKKAFRARPLSQIYAVRQIIAIEAKISVWSEVMQQAMLNTWFTADSYVLIPQMPVADAFAAEINALGVGVWTQSHGRVREPTCGRDKMPRSYASWLFNDWAWRASRD